MSPVFGLSAPPMAGRRWFWFLFLLLVALLGTGCTPDCPCADSDGPVCPWPPTDGSPGDRSPAEASRHDGPARDAGDGMRPDAAPGDGPAADTGPLTLTPAFTINGDPSSTHGYGTVKPGAPVTFASAANCPAGVACSYSWSFGNGQSGSGATPAPVTYASAGLYHVSLTVKDPAGASLGTANGVITAWNGAISDSFARTSVDWDQHFWLKPQNPGAAHSIVGGKLHVKHDLKLPGSSAILSSPLLDDTHLEVTVGRHATATTEHYTNIILRVDPAHLAARFYRVQIKEGTAANGNELAVEIYKVKSASSQVGARISSAPAILVGYDAARTRDFRVVVDLFDDAAGRPTFNVAIAAADAPNAVLLRLFGVKDPGGATPAYTSPGFAGLSHYVGETEFDDFLLSSTVSVPGDGGVGDGAALDGGVPDGAPADAGWSSDGPRAELGPAVDLAAQPDQAQPDQMVPDQFVPDQMPPDIGPPPPVTPQILINGSQSGIATVLPGSSLSFAAQLTCPAPYSCVYAWDFGGGATATGKTPSAVTYSGVGIHRVTLSVTDATGYTMGSATALVTVWQGSMSDDFNRAAIGWDQHLWLKPLSNQAPFSIKNNWLYTQHSLKEPGSGAIRAAPLVKDVHVEVTVRRSPIKTVVHYADVVLRMHPKKLNGAFYRVRIKEGLAIYNNELDLEIFKIINPAAEHGISINPSPAILSGFDPNRQTDIRVIIDLYDDAQGVPTFDVVFADASDPTKTLVQLKGVKDTDTHAPPHTHAGFVGLTQYDGETYFDDLLVRPYVAPVPDGGVSDAGAPDAATPGG